MLFGKNKAEQEEDTESGEDKPKAGNVDSGNPKMDMELTRIKAQIDGFAEIRKSNSERFSRISEQIGELRGMIMDSNKSMGNVEVKATRAADLVSSVQPEKLMIDVRKVEGKVEGLKANIDSNDAIMKDIMRSLKEMRQQMNFYKGIEQVEKLNEEVKKELMEIKKVEANAKRHADRIDTIFIEFNKKFTDFENFNNIVKDANRGIKRLESDFDKMKVKLEVKEDKKEFEKLLDKFNQFEKHTTNILNLLDERSKQTKDNMLNDFNRIKQKVADKFEVNMNSENGKKEGESNGSENSETKTEKPKKKGIFGFMKKDENKETSSNDSKEESSSN
ncbi:hypothetical protein C0585_06990 [Candidatus Woesearchaeota archaeon]|nr:MAG: hypothetical protein C0585_06990 [Candidatus Woesearchaeota archaeon]